MLNVVVCAFFLFGGMLVPVLVFVPDFVQVGVHVDSAVMDVGVGVDEVGGEEQVEVGQGFAHRAVKEQPVVFG
jgi:hypothetical protein